jgi:hypothetical protein
MGCEKIGVMVTAHKAVIKNNISFFLILYASFFFATPYLGSTLIMAVPMMVARQHAITNQKKLM